jgi:hypothetical protein
MSVLTTIEKIPVFSTIDRAQAWGRQFGLTGYHTHTVMGQVGYMAGKDHNQAVTSVRGGVTPTSVSSAFGGIIPSNTTPAVTPVVRVASTQASSSGSSSGGSGGY